MPWRIGRVAGEAEGADLVVVPVHVVMVMIVAVMVMMVSVLMGMALTLRLLDGFRLQPCGDIGDLAVEAEEAAGDDGFGRRIRVQHRGAGVEPVQSLAQAREAARIRRRGRSWRHDPLGDGRLLHALRDAHRAWRRH